MADLGNTQVRGWLKVVLDAELSGQLTSTGKIIAQGGLDITGNVTVSSGDIIIDNAKAIITKNGAGGLSTIVNMESNNNLNFRTPETTGNFYLGMANLSAVGNLYLQTAGAIRQTILANGDVAIGGGAPTAKLEVDGDIKFASDGAGANWLQFIRTGVNKWTLNSDGVGTIFKAEGNTFSIDQDVIIRRGGLNIENTLDQVSLEVKGMATQTANLQEWQNNAGDVLASVDAAGSFKSLSIRANAANGGLYYNYFSPTASVNQPQYFGYNSSIQSHIPGFFIVNIANGTLSNTSGLGGAVKIYPTYNQASGTAANTDLLINRTETAIGSGEQLLIDAQVDGISKFNINNQGTITVYDDAGSVPSIDFGGSTGTKFWLGSDSYTMGLDAPGMMYFSSLNTIDFRIGNNQTTSSELRVDSTGINVKSDVAAKSVTLKDSSDVKSAEIVYNETTTSIDFNFLV